MPTTLDPQIATRLTVRPIQPEDSIPLKPVLLAVYGEFGCLGNGFASSDPELDDMYATYDHSGAKYWVVADKQTGELYGGGGYIRLKKTTPEEAVCELQKLYLLPSVRGLGFGKKIMENCLTHAKADGYKTMYLETIEAMRDAAKLYTAYEFEFIPGPMGDTGHYDCNTFMARPL